VRLREVGFKTDHTATLAGKVALRDFLSGLADEKAQSDVASRHGRSPSMPVERISLTHTQRAALQMLAASPRGYTLSTVMARGFAYEMLWDLVRVGLAATHRDAVGTGRTKLARLRITAEGRKAITE
jgi:hypothetical protein